MSERLPVTVLTGFLGSGKTTLLERLLAQAAFGETAVIVNELGEVAIDHHLLRRVDERTVVLGNGCVCCALRGDLADELRNLLSLRTRGQVPRFRRIVLETTGLADPAPILNTLVVEPVVRHHFKPEVVVTTVDAVNGSAQLDQHAESLQQAAAADVIVLTKTDLAEGQATERLAERLAGLNPTARLVTACFGAVAAETLLECGRESRRESAVRGITHDGELRVFTVDVEQEVDWTAFGIWLSMLLQSCGPDVLRVKGLLNVGLEGPVLLNGVQHVVYPPVHLDAWPDEDRFTRIVFITRGIEREEVEASLAAFQVAARAVPSHA